jgi:hypothetical protein
MSVKLIVLENLGTVVRFQTDAFFFANCTDRLFSININSCNYFEIAYCVRFNQLIFFYQTKWLHIKHTQQFSVLSVEHVSNYCAVFRKFLHQVLKLAKILEYIYNINLLAPEFDI